MDLVRQLLRNKENRPWMSLVRLFVEKFGVVVANWQVNGA
jgi:hypothetical protein